MSIKTTDQPIHVSFEVDQKDWITFWQFNMIKSRNHSLMKKVSFILWGFIGFGPLIWTFYYYGFKYDNNLSILDPFDWIMAFGPLLISITYFYVYFEVGKKTYRKNKIFSQLTYTFDFGIDDFQVSSSSENSSGNSTIKTLLMRKIYETRDYFYLFNSQRTAFIVKKASMSEEDAFVLRRRLQNVLGKKYIVSR